MKKAAPKTILLKDYKKPDFLISNVDLTFYLDDTKTLVRSKMSIKRNPKAQSSVQNLILNGEELELISIMVNGSELTKDRYIVEEESLTILNLPIEFVLEIENKMNPLENKALDGLYKSGDIFCTQNEAEGFRRITYYLDRPDVMAKFSTKIIADKKKYPILLSNGNPTGHGDLENGEHWVSWKDPFPKPCYLYALVAGNLGLVQDIFTTMSGRTIDCRIYCDKGNESRCDHAMESLKKSMRWDEETFGLEYDLDIYMIVAVDSFNMGAMENKGLNIFNSVYVLASEETATDDNFLGIESVVGHEYFHNWTGNRITCRDWFQLTLKEGLTVYRDQEFSADLNSRAVQRIQDVKSLRARQFVEDAGPTSHPIRPDQYMEINNFYTATVYEKGAEVIRMVRTFLGVEGFRKGMDLYFKLFDGQAVTTEDFLRSMSEANNNYDLEQFKNWYNQSQTPEIKIDSTYNEESNELSLTIEQLLPETHLSYHFPFALGLINKKAGEIELNLDDDSQIDLARGILHIKNKKETFVFKNVNEAPVLSLNRGFSAPIKLKVDYSNEELAFLMAHDKDEFNRYEASQVLATNLIFNLLDKIDESSSLEGIVLDDLYIESYGALLKDKKLDPAFKAIILGLPSEGMLHQNWSPIEFQNIHLAREFMIKTLAQKHRGLFESLYHENTISNDYSLDPKSIGQRSLRNLCLGYIGSLGDEKSISLCWEQFKNATNMTDEINAFSLLSHSKSEKREKASLDFYKKWENETLVMQKWLGVEALNPDDNVFEYLSDLEKSSVYDKTIPNLVRSLWASFANNHTQFHHESGRGYRLLADKILELDQINPQIASRIVGAFKCLSKVKNSAKKQMRPELIRIKETPGLSKNVLEIVSKILE